MLHKQILIAAGMALAVGVILLVVTGRAPLGNVLFIDDTAARLAYAIKWLVVPALCLFVGISMMANRQFFSSDAIDGTRTPESRSLEINLRYNQNTLEQTVLAAIAWLGVALMLPADRIGLIPILACLFAAGQALFWIGYLIAPWARALGLGLTFYPTAAALLWLAWKMIL